MIVENDHLALVCATGSILRIYKAMESAGVIREENAQREDGEPLGRLDSSKFFALRDVAVVLVEMNEGRGGETFTESVYKKWGGAPRCAEPLQGTERYVCFNCREFALYNACPNAYAAFILHNGPVSLRDKPGPGRPKIAANRKRTMENSAKAAKKRKKVEGKKREARKAPAPKNRKRPATNEGTRSVDPPAPDERPATEETSATEEPASAEENPPPAPRASGPPQNTPAVYHESQRADYCLLHAVNNLLGRPAYKVEDFREASKELTKARKDYSQNYSYAENGNWQIEVCLHVLTEAGYIVDFGYQGGGGEENREL